MNFSHAAFFDRPEAQPLKTVITRPDMLPQYELLSRIELPAVQAVVWEIEPLIEKMDKAARDHAIRSSGALIGDLLSARGFRIARDQRGEKRRGRVRHARFVKSGTIWERPSETGSEHRAKVDAIMEKIMVEYRTTLTELAK